MKGHLAKVPRKLLCPVLKAKFGCGVDCPYIHPDRANISRSSRR